jgi:uncharacterized protein (DUF697 family)
MIFRSAEAPAWTVVPGGPADLEALAARCRRLVRTHAMVAAGVAMVPVPLVGAAADVAVLVRVLNRINAEFGLSPGQIERLAPAEQVAVYKALSNAGAWFVGKVMTRALVITLLKVQGPRLAGSQLLRWVPVAGQAASAALTFGALRWVCEQHIEQCVRVAGELTLPAPEPVDPVFPVEPPGAGRKSTTT